MFDNAARAFTRFAWPRFAEAPMREQGDDGAASRSHDAKPEPTRFIHRLAPGGFRVGTLGVVFVVQTLG